MGPPLRRGRSSTAGADCGSEDTKLGVFALFHRLRQPFGDIEAAASGGESVRGRLKESLTDMAPMQRQILLLTVLEGFTVEMLPTFWVSASMTRNAAGRSASRIAARRFGAHPGHRGRGGHRSRRRRHRAQRRHEVVGIAATEKAAIELAKKHSPHLVLADIQLRGSDSGISAVNQIMKSMSVPVIFVTGFPRDCSLASRSNRPS